MDMEEPEDGKAHAMSDSSPVRLVCVEIGDQLDDVALDANPGDRLWIEVAKHGQIVGVVEKAATGVGLPASVMQELAQEYSDFEVSSYRSIPDHLLPKATVVVPTIYRRAGELARTVESLLSLDYPDFEIILVDNRIGSDNHPIQEFSDSERVRVELEPTPGAASARNRGIAAASGEIIAFTDDDAYVDRNWLRALGVKFAMEADVDAIGGMVRPKELGTKAQLWFEEFYGGFTKHFLPRKWSIDIVGDSDPLFPYSAGQFGAGVNMAFRRSTFERFGGFDTRLGIGTKSKGGEDLKIFLEVLLGGGTVAFEPTALVRHSHRLTSREFMTQVFGYGTGLTAMYTSVVVEDRRHLMEIWRRAPRGLRLLLHPKERKSPSVITNYPRRTQACQLLGMAYGPFAYVQSLVAMRKSK